MRALGRFLCVLTALLLLSGCGPSPEVQNKPKPVFKAWLPAAGASMLPKFPIKAEIEIEIGVPFAALKEGDSVVFWDYERGPMAMTHHRLIQKQAGAWMAKGDNNKVVDPSWVTEENYLARGTGKWEYILVPPVSK